MLRDLLKRDVVYHAELRSRPLVTTLSRALAYCYPGSVQVAIDATRNCPYVPPSYASELDEVPWRNVEPLRGALPPWWLWPLRVSPVGTYIKENDPFPGCFTLCTPEPFATYCPLTGELAVLNEEVAGSPHQIALMGFDAVTVRRRCRGYVILPWSLPPLLTVIQFEAYGTPRKV